MRWQWPVWADAARAGGTSAVAAMVMAMAPEATPRQRSARRWRVPGFRAPAPATYPAPLADPAADAPAVAAAIEALPVPTAAAPIAVGHATPREPGVLAVAIARVLIAIDFALPGRRDRLGR